MNRKLMHTPPNGLPETLVTARFVTIPLGAAVTGLTEKAIQRKIEKGDWLEGYEYRRGPDGKIYVDLDGFARWVSGAR